MYTVAQAAKILEKSKKTIYRWIEDLPLDFYKSQTVTKENDKGSPVLYMSDVCFNRICKEHLSGFDEDAYLKLEAANTMENPAQEMVVSLLDLLKQKDAQIAEMNNQISELLSQCKNYQVLLQSQQFLALPEKKRSLFSRLFRVESDSE